MLHSITHTGCLHTVLWIPMSSLSLGFWCHLVFFDNIEPASWSVWLCREKYTLLPFNPRQVVCFDRCTKPYTRQSGAGTCKAHWVWIDSCWAQRCDSSVGRLLSLRDLIYFLTLMKKLNSRKPIWHQLTVILRNRILLVKKSYIASPGLMQQTLKRCIRRQGQLCILWF